MSFETAEKNGADIVLFNSTREEINKVHNKNIKKESDDKKEILKSVLSFEIQTSTCFGIFKRELIIKQKLFLLIGYTKMHQYYTNLFTFRIEL